MTIRNSGTPYLEETSPHKSNGLWLCRIENERKKRAHLTMSLLHLLYIIQILHATQQNLLTLSHMRFHKLLDWNHSTSVQVKPLTLSCRQKIFLPKNTSTIKWLIYKHSKLSKTLLSIFNPHYLVQHQKRARKSDAASQIQKWRFYCQYKLEPLALKQIKQQLPTSFAATTSLFK